MKANEEANDIGRMMNDTIEGNTSQFEQDNKQNEDVNKTGEQQQQEKGGEEENEKTTRITTENIIIEFIEKKNTIDDIIEREKQKNKNEIWSKIDKSLKIQRLHAFAEKYGKDHGHSVKDIKTLKAFFVTALEKGKLSKTKDLVYDKEKREITSIPSLYFDNHNFTLKNMDPKRVSTLKSLAPNK
jgi:hypothetical protein